MCTEIDRALLDPALPRLYRTEYNTIRAYYGDGHGLDYVRTYLGLPIVLARRRFWI